MVVYGRLLTDTGVRPEEPVGCIELQACADSASMATDTGGDCYRFADTCRPLGWLMGWCVP
jgi:hypothetical protein